MFKEGKTLMACKGELKNCFIYLYCKLIYFSVLYTVVLE